MELVKLSWYSWICWWFLILSTMVFWTGFRDWKWKPLFCVPVFFSLWLVLVGGERSSPSPLQCGMTQGLDLSSLLFKVYMKPKLI